MTAIDSLLEFRQRCGLKDMDQYVLAFMGDDPVSSGNALQALAIQPSCKKPELLTSSRLRKYVAAVAQVGGFSIVISMLNKNKGFPPWWLIIHYHLTQLFYSTQVPRLSFLSTCRWWIWIQQKRSGWWITCHITWSCTITSITGMIQPWSSPE